MPSQSKTARTDTGHSKKERLQHAYRQKVQAQDSYSYEPTAQGQRALHAPQEVALQNGPPFGAGFFVTKHFVKLQNSGGAHARFRFCALPSVSFVMLQDVE